MERYEFIREIGSGGQGRISLYKDIQANTEVIIKECKDITQETHKRFLREMQTMKKFKHPHLIEYLDFFEKQNAPCIVMEYLPGGSLQDKISKQGKISWQQAVEILQQVIDGLAALHTNQEILIHRDIKPGNILFTQEGKAKLGDFGLVTSDAYFVEKITAPDVIVKPGTVAYLPIEFFDNEAPCDPRSDIYSLGITFYEMITGKHPFLGDDDRINIFKLILKIEEGDYLAADRCIPELPIKLAEIIEKMMAKNVEERYQTLSDIKKDLEAFGHEQNSIAAASRPTSVTTIDPISILEQELGEDLFWAREELCEVPLPASLETFHEIMASLKMMPQSRRKKAWEILTKFCIKYGKWQQACEFAAQMDREQDKVFARHLHSVITRIDAGGSVEKDWYFTSREKIRSKVWPEEEFRCETCNRSFSREDVGKHLVFFLPAVRCRQCLLQTRLVYFGDYRLTTGPIAQDSLGNYYLALSDEQQPYIIHQVPWERKRLSAGAAKNIVRGPLQKRDKISRCPQKRPLDCFDQLPTSARRRAPCLFCHGLPTLAQAWPLLPKSFSQTKISVFFGQSLYSGRIA